MRFSILQIVMCSSLVIGVAVAFQTRLPQSARQSSILPRPLLAHEKADGDISAQNVHPLFQLVDGKKASTFAASLCLSLALVFSPPTTTNSNVAHASGYGSLSDEQKAVAEAWRLVDNSFIDRTFNGQDWFGTRQKLVKQTKYKSMEEAQDSIELLVSTLGDKYTRYLSPAKYQSIVDSAQGTLAGVGIEISTNKDSRVIAADVEAKSPAASSGIKPDDIFVEVDGTKFDTSSTPDDVAVKLRGPVGSKVGVVMERDGKILDYIITRAPIKVTSVKSYTSSVKGVGKVGVIRIKSFSSTTKDTVKQAYEDVTKGGVKGVVFDLRGNPGGLLPGGVETASLFLPKGKPAVYVVNNKGTVDTQTVLEDGIDLETPLVVFVDSQTASAAEVFSAALKENDHRATIVGEKTFGKGIIQTIRPLSNNNGGVAITVARYETPQHNDINKQGIAVDVAASVDCPKDDAPACLPSDAFRSPGT